MTQEVDDLRAQCQQLATQLTGMKQSRSQMLLEHEKMTVSDISATPILCALMVPLIQLTISNLAEEKASILDSNTELADQVLD